jgi:hypothetical protein
MTSNDLDNLVRTGKLKREPPSEREQAGLRRIADAKLADAANASLSFDSRFDLLYGAAHALALLALRRLGYRAGHRFLVFRVLQHTTHLPAEWQRVLSKAHEHRNLAEYEGHVDHDEKLYAALVEAVARLREEIERLSA